MKTAFKFLPVCALFAAVFLGAQTPQYPPLQTGTGQLFLNGLNPATLQTNIVGPVIYDHFLAPDNTPLSGRRAESGNSTWITNGGGTATIVGNRYINSLGVGANVYSWLPNSATNGGATSSVTTIGGTFRYCVPAGGTYDGTQDLTIIAGDTGINNVLHFVMGPLSWALEKRVGGGAFVGLAGATFTHPLSVDCQTEYSASMDINVAAGTVLVHPPDGTTQTLITDPDITTINPQNGGWQNRESLSTSAVIQWGSVWLGGPPQAQKMMASGSSAQLKDLSLLWGAGGSRHNITSFYIPVGNANTNWRLETQTSLGGWRLYGYPITITATGRNSGLTQIVVLNAGSTTSTTSPSVTQVDQKGDVVFDSFTISTDGSSNIALDGHINSGFNTEDWDVKIDAVGQMTPVLFPVSGASAYANLSTAPIAIPPVPINASLTGGGGGPGYYTIMTESSQCGGFCIQGTFTLTATSNLGAQTFSFNAYCYTSGGTIYPLWSKDVGTVNKLRCSTDGTHVHLDLNQNLVAGHPVTVTGVGYGNFSPNNSPSVGATALGTFSTGDVAITQGLAPVPLTQLATQAANTVVANATSGVAVPTAATLPNCLGQDLTYDTTSHSFTCVPAPQKIVSCGTTTTCSNTTLTTGRIVTGTVALTSGTPSTAVVTGMTAWTSTTSYVCTATNMTTQANPIKVTNTSTTSITLTGPATVTDTVAYSCAGN